MIGRLLTWGPDFSGSTRPVALLRIGLALVIWTRFGRDMALHSNLESWQLVFSLWFFLFTFLMLVGLYTRVAVPVVALLLAGLYFGFGLGGVRPHYYAHHIYLMMVASAFLSLTPCGRSYSVDRLRAVLKAEREGASPPAEFGNLGGQRLIVLQMAAIYFWGAVNKTGPHFLSGDRLEAIFMWAHSGRPLESLFLSPTFLIVGSVAAVAVEYFLAFGILVRGLRPIAVPLGLAFHAALFVTLPLATFSISMFVLYLAVLDPDVVHRWIDRVQGHPGRQPAGRAS